MGNKKPVVDPTWHKKQIEQYTVKKAIYETYAKALRRVLESAKALSIPEAIVQSRPKAVASFAEKCVRKHEKYDDPVNQLTDLCGARVIVHTLDQVKAVSVFLKCNFEILEEDPKGLLLGKDRFGYRDLHYLIRLKKERAEVVGFTPDEISTIGDSIAELQVRTVVQHAWADVLHDRMYKTKLIYPPEFQRGGALLAAIMEDGDQQFNGLADKIDGMLTNFNVYAARSEVEKEIDVQDLIHQNADPNKEPVTALGLAKLRAAQGEYGEICNLLGKHAQTPDPLRLDILLELGFALCKCHAPNAPEYKTGQDYLKEVIKECQKKELDCIPNLRKERSMLARALTRLAWSCEVIQGGTPDARKHYLEALRLEPDNPYYLSEVLAFEIKCTGNRNMVSTMGSVIDTAIAACEQHAENGTELPYAYFTAGRLLLLLDRSEEAFVNYALGIRHLQAGDLCVPPEVLDQETAWVYRACAPEEPTGGYGWVLDLIELHQKTGKDPAENEAALSSPIVIVAGSAGIGITKKDETALTEALKQGLVDTQGTIISGGTKVGVPLCIVDAVEQAAAEGNTVPKLLGYLPNRLPTGTECDSRCEIKICGEDDFSPAQLLCYWKDILSSGIEPEDVTLFGYGGGKISLAEYVIALMLGASVFLTRGSGRSADELLKREADIPNLKGLPNDAASICALFWAKMRAGTPLTQDAIEAMAKIFHSNYVNDSQGKIPANMRAWDKLPDTYVQANMEQARYATEILRKHGYDVVPVSAPGTPLQAEDLNNDVPAMSELEHGRWNVERLGDGWRLGERNDAVKTHDNIVPWEDLPDSIRYWDRQAVSKYPEVLSSVGLKIVKSN